MEKKFSIGAFHVGQAESHTHIAKCHVELGKLHKLIASAEKHKSAQGVRDDCHESIAKCHKELSEHHADLAEQHVKVARALQLEPDGEGSLPDIDEERRTNDEGMGLNAAAGSFGMTAARDFSKIRPDGVHGAMPRDIPKLVPRPGTATNDDSQVPEQFKHLVDI